MKTTITFLLTMVFLSTNAQHTFLFDAGTVNVPIPDDAYDGTEASMGIVDLEITGIPSGLHFVTANSQFTVMHNWVGDLTFKFKEPDGKVLALMSRPGHIEPSDNGEGVFGSSSNLIGYIFCRDFATVLSEDIGTLGTDIPIGSNIAPSPGAIPVPPAYPRFHELGLAIGNSENFNGTWKFMAGDSALDYAGTIEFVDLLLKFDDYCPSFIGNEFDYITNVTFAGINHDSTNDGVDAHPVYNTDLEPAVVTKGLTYPISVTVHPYENEYTNVFFDWNQDHDFDDAGETFIIVVNTNLPGPHTVDIPIPASAVTGTTRMRVLTNYLDATPIPCRDGGYGEAEDYLVTVEPSLGTEDVWSKTLSTYPNPVEAILTIDSKVNIKQITIYDMAGQEMLTKIGSNDFQIQLDVSHLSAGVYVVKVQTEKGFETTKILKK